MSPDCPPQQSFHHSPKLRLLLSFDLLPPRLSSPAAQTVLASVCLSVLHPGCVFSSPDILVSLLRSLPTPLVPLLRCTVLTSSGTEPLSLTEPFGSRSGIL